MRNLKSKRGVTVLEVLLAIFVLLIGVTGVLALFPVGVKLNHDSNDQVIAAMTAQNALAALRAEVGIVVRAKGWTTTNTSGDVLNWDGTISRGVDTCGGTVSTVGGTLLDDRVEAIYTIAGATASTTSDLVLSTTVMGAGTYNDGYTSPNGCVELVRHVPLSSASPYPISYTQAGATMDLDPYVCTGGDAGNWGSDVHGRGGKLWLPRDSESQATSDGIGFGCHANWMVTFNLQKIREVHFANQAGQFTLTGRFGMDGRTGGSEGTNMVYGYVFADGVLGVASTPQNSTSTTVFPVYYEIPMTTTYLTLGILNGDNSTSWDDGTFRSVKIRMQAISAPFFLNPKLASSETYKDDSAIMMMTNGNAMFKPYRLDRYATLSPSVAASWKPGVSSFLSDGVLATDTFNLIGARDLNHEWLTVPRQFYGDGTTNPSKYTLGKGAAAGYGYLVFVNRVAGSETTFAVHILVYKGYDESLPPEANAPPVAYFTTVLSDTLLR